MKAIINGIEFEGTPEEFVKLIGKHDSSASSKSSEVYVFDPKRLNGSSKPKSKDDAKNESKVVAEVMETYLSGTAEFLAALYRYRPKFGGASYAFQLFATGKAFTVRSLAQKAGVSYDAVYEVLQRSFNAGCKIGIDNNHVAPGTLQRSKKTLSVSGSTDDTISIALETKIRLISLGTVEQAKAAADSTRVAFRKNKDSKTKAVVVSTGSPPVTKIVYN